MSAEQSRKRGREMELAIRPDFPNPQNYYSYEKSLQINAKTKRIRHYSWR